MPFVKGNNKLGAKILHWSMPSVTTCPGRSALCEKFCYGNHGNYLHTSVKNSLRLNEAISRSEYFVAWAATEMKIHKPRVVRIHADGDFYDPAYVKKWLTICKANPRVAFYAYTRSWRDAKIRKQLEKLSKLRNVSLWYSVDQETGIPARKPRRVKLAYMQVDDNDHPVQQVDLVFRVNKLRKTVIKKVTAQDGSTALVCPPENGVTEVTCMQCKVCFKRALPRLRAKVTEPGNRIALPMVAA